MEIQKNERQAERHYKAQLYEYDMRISEEREHKMKYKKEL